MVQDTGSINYLQRGRDIVSKILEEALTISKKEIITTVGGDFQEFGKL